MYVCKEKKMTMPNKSSVYINDDYYFTSCCGSDITNKDIGWFASCSKCQREIEKVYKREEAMEFIDQICHVSRQMSFKIPKDVFKKWKES
tara:strand:- start:1143 stop:1412 length:270 start_codon:yes stop_codon:yes gene_type:complete